MEGNTYEEECIRREMHSEEIHMEGITSDLEYTKSRVHMKNGMH